MRAFVIASICLTTIACAELAPEVSMVTDDIKVPEDSVPATALAEAETDIATSSNTAFGHWWRRLRHLRRERRTRMKIACPVMRGLAGSGFVKRIGNKAGTFVANVEETLAAIKKTLGFSDAAMKPFNGIKKKMGRKGTNMQGKMQNVNGQWDLTEMHKFLGHAASTGIIGSATTGATADHDFFNQNRYDMLMKLAVGNQFTPTAWGNVVNHFAQLGHKGKNGGKNMKWSDNKLSWAILTLEMSNTLAAFNNNFIRGSTGSSISKAAVASLYKEGKLPANFIPANGKERITPRKLKATVKSMAIKAPCTVVDDMRAAAKSGSKCNKHPDTVQCVTGTLQSNYCGKDFKWCAAAGCHPYTKHNNLFCNTYGSIDGGAYRYTTLAAAQAACDARTDCGGVKQWTCGAARYGLCGAAGMQLRNYGPGRCTYKK